MMEMEIMIKRETRTEILTAFMFELIKFDRCSRLVGGIGSEKRNDGEIPSG